MFAPCVLPVVARGAYVAPLRAGSSRRRPRPARSVRSRATVPVRSASSSAESDFDDLSDVTRDVLAFHAAERNGNGDRGRGGERTVPLESWAARYGWTVDAAERVLWQADVPLKSSIGAGDANPIGKNVRIVDAKSAYVGVWLAFVEADHVVSPLLARERGDPNSTAVKGGGSMTKKQALDAASAQLATRHAASQPEGGGCIQRRSTVAAWGDVIRALRRRYRKGDDACPCALLTKKVKTRRAYRAVRAGSSERVADVEATRQRVRRRATQVIGAREPAEQRGVDPRGRKPVGQSSVGPIGRLLLHQLCGHQVLPDQHLHRLRGPHGRAQSLEQRAGHDRTEGRMAVRADRAVRHLGDVVPGRGAAIGLDVDDGVGGAGGCGHGAKDGGGSAVEVRC